MSDLGWIKLFRQSKFNEMYCEKPFDHFHAWIDLLLCVNHEDKMIRVDGKLVTLKRGQMLTSMRKLGERWGWGHETVRRFLFALERDEMCRISRDSRETVITVAKWDFFQADEKKVRRQRDSDETHTLSKNVKNVKKEEYILDQNAVADFKTFWQAYPKKIGKGNAEKAWNKLHPDSALLVAMLDALEWQKQTSQWQKESGQFIPHPATWLNGHRWQDEQTATKTKSSTKDALRQIFEEVKDEQGRSDADDSCYLAGLPEFHKAD